MNQDQTTETLTALDNMTEEELVALEDAAAQAKVDELDRREALGKVLRDRKSVV